MSRLLIQLKQLYKSFSHQSLFDGLHLSVHVGECFALIGENGCGKTTLMRILAGQEQPDSGAIQRSSNLSIGLLPQEVAVANNSVTARSFLSEGPLSQLEEQMTALQDHLDIEDNLQAWGSLHEEFERRGGYQRIPVEEVLYNLQIQTELDIPLGLLSSGQRVRVALAKALVENPDLLLLDEPTNHLDKKMLEWLEDVIRNRKGATIIISHDRQFLNATCNRLLELKQGQLTCYGGNYDYYLAEKERRLEKRLKDYEEQKEEIALLKQKIKAMSFSKRSATAATDKNVMAYDRRGEKHQKSIQRTLNELKDRLEELEQNPLQHPKPKGITGIRFASVPLNSRVVIELDGVGKAYGSKTLFKSFSKTLLKGERVILQGINGSGKTTLLNCIMGLTAVDEGKIYIAPSAKIAFLDQEIEHLPKNKTPLDYFSGKYNLSYEELLKELYKAALGDANLLERPFETLSVGQRKRLMLLSIILEKPNVVLLDEPTNHLDLATLEALEKALLSFEGALLAVSHDEQFIQKIATTSWILKGDL